LAKAEKIDIENALSNRWGERRGGPRGTPEEVPPPPWEARGAVRRRGRPRATPQKRDLPRPDENEAASFKPLKRMWDWVKRAAHAGKGWEAMCTSPSEASPKTDQTNPA